MSKYIKSKYTYFWDSSIYNIIFICYKHYNREKNVKDASKEDERNISIYPRIIYFFGHFAIYNPYVTKKFSPSPLGYSIGVILPLG